MSREQLATYSIKGIDRATPARDTAPGTCLAIENMIPVGPPSEPYWSIATPSEQKGSANGIVSLGRQTRQRIGPLADTDADPDQSLERLLALKAGGVYVIDPGQGYQERQLYEFAFADSTRRAHFTQLGESVFMSVTRGGGNGTPDQLLEVRDDAVHPFGWPDLPIVGVEFTESDDEDAIPDGTYAIRWAYLLDDGSIGPASGPIEVATGTSSVAGWEATFTIEEIPTPIPAFYEDRLAGLAVLVQAPVTDDQGDVTVPAVDAPAYQVARFEEIETGATLTWQNTREGIAAGDFYQGSGVRQHDVTAGTAYSYNKRLLLGDVAYDLDQPDLRRIVDWTPGESNGGGDDVWLIMRVRIKTAVGIIERFSDPLPFDSTAAETVETRSGLIWYRDSRATRWDWFVSTDYSGDVSAATWNVPVLSGNDHTFEDAGGGNYSYHRTSGEPFDISTYSEGDQSVATAFTGELEAYAFDYDADNDSGSNADTNDSETATLTVSDVLGGGETLQEVRVSAQVSLSTDPGSAGEASAEGSVLVEVLDSSDAVLDSAIREYEGSETLVLDGFTPSDAATIRITTDASANADQGGGTAATAQATASANDVNITTSTGASETVDISAVEANSDDDRDPNRIIYSEPFQPLNYPPANAIYAGESNSDTVLAMATVGQEVSEGQFGQYPIICFGAESIRLLEVGTDPFINAVTPLTTDMGLVGRDAWTNVDGLIYAVSDRGVYRLTPQLEDTPISYPLHDIEANFLSSLGPGSVLGFYNDRDRGRRELWLSGVGQTWVWSFAHQTWTSLSRERRSFARLSRLFGIDTSGQLQDELGPNEPTDFTIVTNLFQLGQTGYAERIRELVIEQRFNAEELNWQLVAKDPNATLVLDQDSLNRATLPSGLLARDLLPNILVEEGTLVRGDLGTIRLPKALGYSWFLRLEGTAKPDQGIEGFGATFQPRRRSRAPSMFPDQPETKTMSYQVDVDAGQQTGIRLDYNGGSAPDIAGVLWGDGDATAGTANASHTYEEGGVYTITIVAQPDFTRIDRIVPYGVGVKVDTLDFSKAENLSEVYLNYTTDADGNPTWSGETQPGWLPGFIDALRTSSRSREHRGSSAVSASNTKARIFKPRFVAKGDFSQIDPRTESIEIRGAGAFTTGTQYSDGGQTALKKIEDMQYSGATWRASYTRSCPDLTLIKSLRNHVTGNITDLMSGDLVSVYGHQSVKGDPREVDWSNRPPLEQYVSFQPTSFLYYHLGEDDWQYFTADASLQFAAGRVIYRSADDQTSGVKNDVIWGGEVDPIDYDPAGTKTWGAPGGLAATIDGLYKHRAAVGAGLSVKLQQAAFGNLEKFGTVTTIPDEQLFKVIGTGSYRDDGVLDHISSLQHDCIVDFEIVSASTGSITISRPETVVFDNNEPRYGWHWQDDILKIHVSRCPPERDSDGYKEVFAAYSNSGGDTHQMLCRGVIAGGTDQHFEITGASYDAANEEVTLSVTGQQAEDDASALSAGDRLWYGISFPL